MQRINFGNVINAGRIALGTWSIGGWMWGGTEEKQAISTILSAFEKGINVIDTAPVYGFGKSEEIIGKALKEFKDKDKIIIATKAGLDWKDGKIFRNSGKKRILKEFDDSLKRLGVDHIDLYQIHWPDAMTDIGETADTMRHLFEQKKICAIGVSNFSVEQMKLFKRYSPLHTTQPPYNLFEREIEKDIQTYCFNSDIRIVGYGALCRGLLSGKLNINSKFDGDDLRNSDPKFQKPRFEQYLNAVAALDNYAMLNYNKNVLQLALRWLLDKKTDIILVGARTPEQLEDIHGLEEWNLSENDMMEIDFLLHSIIKDPVGPEFMTPPSR